MERNLPAELDTLQQQMNRLQSDLQSVMQQLAARQPSQELQGIMQRIAAESPEAIPQHLSPPVAPRGEGNPTVGHVEKMVGMHPLPEVNAILDRLENSCGADGSTGRVAYMGVFASGGRQSTWVRHDLNTDSLLALIENRTAEKALACIGSNDRLSLLLAILRKPRTVAEMVSDCGFSSTGQVYHHLKPLIAADLVAEDKRQRGVYIVQPHRVQGVIMLLAGVADLVDGTYTRGELE